MYSYAIVGRRGEGKSTFVKSIVNRFLSNRVKYIFDFQNEYNDVCKNFDFRDTSKDFDNFVNSIVDVQNSVVIFDEATIFFSHQKRTQNILKYLVSSRHNNNVTFFCFHSLRRVPLEILDFTNYMCIFRTNDLISNIKKKYQETPIIWEGYESVMNNKNVIPPNGKPLMQYHKVVELLL